MTCHDYVCPQHGTLTLYKKMHDKHWTKCPECGKDLTLIISAPAVKSAPDQFWETENGGRGRYISQLQQVPGKPNDPNAFCRSQSEIFEKAKKLGLHAERVR